MSVTYGIQPPTAFRLESDSPESMLAFNVADTPHYRKVEICLWSCTSKAILGTTTARKDIGFQGNVAVGCFRGRLLCSFYLYSFICAIGAFVLVFATAFVGLGETFVVLFFSSVYGSLGERLFLWTSFSFFSNRFIYGIFGACGCLYPWFPFFRILRIFFFCCTSFMLCVGALTGCGFSAQASPMHNSTASPNNMYDFLFIFLCVLFIKFPIREVCPIG